MRFHPIFLFFIGFTSGPVWADSSQSGRLAQQDLDCFVASEKDFFVKEVTYQCDGKTETIGICQMRMACYGVDKAHPRGFKPSELVGREPSLKETITLCPAINPRPAPPPINKHQLRLYDCPPENVCYDTGYAAQYKPKMDLQYVPRPKASGKDGTPNRSGNSSGESGNSHKSK